MSAASASPASPSGTAGMASTADAGALTLTSKPRRRKPGARWDGKVNSLTLQEYRELKWNLQASYNNSSFIKRCPSYSIRGSLSRPPKMSSKIQIATDVCKALDAVRPAQPKWTMSAPALPYAPFSPGPQYKLPDVVGPYPHPSIPKSCGYRFNGAQPLINDEPTAAPGQYSIDDFEKDARIKHAPVYTIQGRESWKDPAVAPGPGVGEYDLSKCTRVGQIRPLKFTIQGNGAPIDPPRGERRYDPDRPGPTSYNVPGANAKNEYVASNRPPKWPASKEPRGLL